MFELCVSLGTMVQDKIEMEHLYICSMLLEEQCRAGLLFITILSYHSLPPPHVSFAAVHNPLG